MWTILKHYDLPFHEIIGQKYCHKSCALNMKPKSIGEPWVHTASHQLLWLLSWSQCDRRLLFLARSWNNSFHYQSPPKIDNWHMPSPRCHTKIGELLVPNMGYNHLCKRLLYLMRKIMEHAYLQACLLGLMISCILEKHRVELWDKSLNLYKSLNME